MKNVFAGGFFFLLPFGVLAVGTMTESVDFSGVALPEGWSAEAGAFVSPVYPNAVTHVALTYGAAIVDESGTLSVYAAGLKIADLNTNSTGASFGFPTNSDLRSFRIVTNGVSLVSFSVSWPDSRLTAPTNVVASGNTGSAFDLSWDAVEGATGYKVSIWTNVVVGASEGIVQWGESFSNSGATTGSSAAFDGVSHTDDKTAGWTCDRVYRSLLQGAIRVGSSGAAGWIATPPFENAYSGEYLAIRLRACATNSSEVVQIPISIVSGGATNDLGVVDIALGPDMAYWYLPIAGIGVDDIVVVRSPVSTKSSGRPVLLLDEITIVSDYFAGTPIPVVFREEPVAVGTTSATLSDLPPCVVSVGVQALAASAQDNSEASTAVVVDLANPPPVPVLAVSSLNVVSHGDGYCENFDALIGLGASATWVDGVTLPYWQARKAGAPVTSIAVKTVSTASQNSGLYAFHGTNKNETSSYSLAGVSKTNNKMYFGFAVTNDADATLSGFSISYTARQWTFAKKVDGAQTLHFEYLVTNEVIDVSASGGWDEVPGLAFASFASFESAEAAGKADSVTGSAYADLGAAFDGVSIKADEVLMLRWTSDTTAGGDALGVDHVVLHYDPPNSGTVLQFVKSKSSGF